jgi:hypothetical protein
MAFKENLLAKIEINRLTRTIRGMIGSVDSGKRIDQVVLKRLIAYFPWQHRQERDLDLYVEGTNGKKTRILVLDNDLTIYNTTVEDVVLRKSPTVKEMVSFRNAIKILNDKDVVMSKKEASLDVIREICIGELDLDFTAADIDAIAGEGMASFENEYAEGVRESLMLLAELLEMAPAPKVLALKHHDIYGRLSEKPDGEILLGPLVIFSRIDDSLACLEGPISSRDKTRFDRLKAAAAGETEAAASGAAVFELMKAKVLAVPPAG